MQTSLGLVRQSKDYTCGIACLQTVALLTGRAVVPGDVMELSLQTHPETGTTPRQMMAWAQTHLPFEAAGEGLWQGQLAIGLVDLTEADGSVEPHYEVFLGRLNRHVVAWCPYYARLRLVPEADVPWKTVQAGQRYSRWSLNTSHRFSEQDLLRLLHSVGVTSSV